MKMETVGGARTSKMTREEVLRRAEALVPVLRERAPEAEKLRRCPDPTIADFVSKDLLRICMPARFGGFELGYDVYCETAKTLAHGCGSQAWIFMVLADNALKLAGFSQQAQEDVWNENPNARLSNAVAPLGKGEVVDGGIKWTGRHPFSSGVDHADWVMPTGFVQRGDKRHTVSVLIPKKDIKIIDDWHVVGLAGTGSKTFEVSGAFVPDHRILTKEDDEAGSSPYKAPVFHLPRGGVSSASYAAVAVGCAEGLLEEYIKYTAPRKSRTTVVAEEMGTQMGIGIAASEIEAASEMLMGPLRETMQFLERGQPVPRMLNLRGKRNAAYAAQLSITAAQKLFNAAGGRALYSDNVMQRMLRDCLAAAAHHSLGWDAAAANYGRHVLKAALDNK
jgi:3-hydroxy-9,10-secoandrosta-1,3,5(10)-triene-9,17-dione monooxygenase